MTGDVLIKNDNIFVKTDEGLECIGSIQLPTSSFTNTGSAANMTTVQAYIPKTVTLEVEEVVDNDLILKYKDQSDLDLYIKSQLAYKLAQKMLEEDLIELKSNLDIAEMKKCFKAKAKIIQE